MWCWFVLKYFGILVVVVLVSWLVSNGFVLFKIDILQSGIIGKRDCLLVVGREMVIGLIEAFLGHQNGLGLLGAFAGRGGIVAVGFVQTASGEISH